MVLSNIFQGSPLKSIVLSIIVQGSALKSVVCELFTIMVILSLLKKCFDQVIHFLVLCTSIFSYTQSFFNKEKAFQSAGRRYILNYLCIFRFLFNKKYFITYICFISTSMRNFKFLALKMVELKQLVLVLLTAVGS